MSLTEHKIITRFSNNYRFLSNFFFYHLIYRGWVFPSVEHAYQSAKDPDNKTWMAYCINRAITPQKLRKVSGNTRIVVPRADWKDVRLGIMEEILRIKFSDPDLARLLIRTHPHILQDHNERYADSFWGIDAKTGKGDNHLGELLMKIRNELIKQDQS